MAKQASAVADAWALKCRKRALAIFRESVQRTIEEAQTPVAKGGKMRVDTGFLRGSGAASLTGMPTGPRRPIEEGATFDFLGDGVTLTIGRAQLGDTIFFGWSAEYARAREAQDGFLRSAAQNWRPTVAKVTQEAKTRIR